MNEEISKLALEHVQVTHAALDKAKATMDKQAADRAQVDKMVPELVELLVTHKRIFPDQREKAAEMLRDPVKALDLLLRNVINPAVSTDPPTIGGPAGEKKAGAEPPPSTVIGGYSGGESPADRKFRECFTPGASRSA